VDVSCHTSLSQRLESLDSHSNMVQEIGVYLGWHGTSLDRAIRDNNSLGLCRDMTNTPNQSSEPTLASVTSPAEQEPRLP
jgi:hypothetical protein